MIGEKLSGFRINIRLDVDAIQSFREFDVAHHPHFQSLIANGGSTCD
ncbi:Uncharacterised protein [Vibrio cholerae]|nr:Uncharacterised protein [Vibrio cholerae]CSI44358.1 Uncharacterised protein [Vibrio cholerae]